MARIRSLKPECWQDEALGTVSRDARLLFVGLITQADDEGRLKGGLPLIRSQVFPYDTELPLEDVEQWLLELREAALIVRYEHRGRSYIAIPTFASHQKINRPSQSRIPPPSPTTHGVLTEELPPDQGSDQGSEGIRSEEDFYAEIIGRFNEAGKDRNIRVDARLLERALQDHRHIPTAELRRVSFACADWLAANAPKNGAKPRVAHLTLRTFLRDLPTTTADPNSIAAFEEGWVKR